MEKEIPTRRIVLAKVALLSGTMENLKYKTELNLKTKFKI